MTSQLMGGERKNMRERERGGGNAATLVVGVANNQEDAMSLLQGQWW